MQQDDDLLECPICFEQMIDVAFPYSPADEAGCNHSFCMNCMKGIYDLSRASGKFPNCPICRRTISSFVRNQLATNLISSFNKVKSNLQEVKSIAVDREKLLTTENENMAQHISELEGELVRSNANNQGEVERSVHMKKMLHLADSEKSILVDRLQEMQRDASTKAEECEDHKRLVTELEQMVHKLQEESAHSSTAFEDAQNAISTLKSLLREKDVEVRKNREERKNTEVRVAELEDYIERSDLQLKKTLSDYEKIQGKVSELEQTVTVNDAHLLAKTEELQQAERITRDYEARFKFVDAELRKGKEEEVKLERRVLELESIARKSDFERTNNGVVVSQLEDMLNRYKEEAKSLEEEKYEYGRKIAMLEGATAKLKIDLRKAEDERTGFKERAWKAERDAELYKKEMEKVKMEFKQKDDANKQSGYLSGFMKKSLTLNPLTAFWGETKVGPMVRAYSDLTFFERRGNTKDSCVWRGKSKTTGTEFAIKRITELAVTAQAFSDVTLFREALILKKIDHPSITKIDSVVLEKGSLYFTYIPFMSMDLEYATNALKLNALQIKSIMYQLVCAVNYMHRQQLVHRNLKPTTVLMSEDCNIKLCGFSHARSVLGTPSLDMYSPVQPVNYTAPEVLASEFGVSDDSVDWKAADVWSIGCIFVELMTGEPVFSSIDRSSYLRSVNAVLECNPQESSSKSGSGLYPPPFKTLSTILSANASRPTFRLAVEVVQNMLQYDPTKRFDTNQLLQHKYFADVANASDLTRGRDISREIGDDCLQQFIDDYCTGIL